MSALMKQLLAAFVLAGLVGAVFLLRHQAGGTAADGQGLDTEESLRRYGFHLREVSKEIRIDFTHQAPTLDAKLDHIMPVMASMGAAVSIVDFDRDASVSWCPTSRAARQPKQPYGHRASSAPPRGETRP